MSNIREAIKAEKDKSYMYGYNDALKNYKMFIETSIHAYNVLLSLHEPEDAEYRSISFRIEFLQKMLDKTTAMIKGD